ncbi:hypothetical protein [Sphingomonas sp.]|uniref:hypothetical protein n=1 Tax=Sphingomonas sp. TaxID=28214 RepID=UPI002DD627EA|nr:hypothetical protein [Sphingomonas sp.]
MSRYVYPIDGDGQSTLLRHLIGRALVDRRRRLGERHPAPLGGDVPDLDRRRRRAARMVECTLSGSADGTIDCARFFGRLASHIQMASDVVGTMLSSVEDVAMDAHRARRLATVVADLFYYLEESVPMGQSVRMCIAIAHDDDGLVVGVGVEGAVNPVSCASATVAMLRARNIVRLLRGQFQRGVDGHRLVFGLTFPADFAERIVR